MTTVHNSAGPAGSILLLLLVSLQFTAVHASEWKTLKEDGLHDPLNPSLQWLQNPGDALGRMPSDNAGNKVDWVRAFDDGYIRPRSSVKGEAEVRMLDTEIIMNDTGSLPRVLFPHRPHTKWLDCENCHEKIFRSKAGATPVTMSKILDGEYCGVCHGAVSFPLTECNRCHSVPLNGATANQ
jgi:c(7)-type cytochrome triheme protein